MTTTQDNIASRLEEVFTRRGFAKPGVAELKTASGVSLRTLYRYFPSRESMVTGALDYRHTRYMAFLADGEPPPGRKAIQHLFRRLADWMHAYAPSGCLSVNAFTAYPDSMGIREAVKRHKEETVGLMARRSGRTALSWELFLLHEGASVAWPLAGMQAIHAAETAALKLIDGGDSD